MDSKIDRREFMQKTGSAVLGTVGGMILIQSATAERQNKSVVQFSHRNIEQWLLETGRHTLDKDIYVVAQAQV